MLLHVPHHLLRVHDLKQRDLARVDLTTLSDLRLRMYAGFVFPSYLLVLLVISFILTFSLFSPCRTLAKSTAYSVQDNSQSSPRRRLVRRSRSWEGSFSTLTKAASMLRCNSPLDSGRSQTLVTGRTGSLCQSPKTSLKSSTRGHKPRNRWSPSSFLANGHGHHSRTSTRASLPVNLEIHCETPDYAVLCSGQESASYSSADEDGSASPSSPSILQNTVLESSAAGSGFLKSAVGTAPVSRAREIHPGQLNRMSSDIGIVNSKQNSDPILTDPSLTTVKFMQCGTDQPSFPLKHSKQSPFVQTNPTQHLVASSRALSVDAQSLAASLQGRGLGGLRIYAGQSTSSMGYRAAGQANALAKNPDAEGGDGEPHPSSSPLYSTIDPANHSVEDHFLGSSTDLKMSGTADGSTAKSSKLKFLSMQKSYSSMAACVSVSTGSSPLQTPASPNNLRSVTSTASVSDRLHKVADSLRDEVARVGRHSEKVSFSDGINDLHDVTESVQDSEPAGLDIPETLFDAGEDTHQPVLTPDGHKTAAFVIPDTLNMGLELERNDLCTLRSNTARFASSGSPMLSGSEAMLPKEMVRELEMDTIVDLPCDPSAATNSQTSPVQRWSSPCINSAVNSQDVDMEESNGDVTRGNIVDLETDVTCAIIPDSEGCCPKQLGSASSVVSRSCHKVNRARLQRSPYVNLSKGQPDMSGKHGVSRERELAVKRPSHLCEKNDSVQNAANCLPACSQSERSSPVLKSTHAGDTQDQACTETPPAAETACDEVIKPLSPVSAPSCSLSSQAVPVSTATRPGKHFSLQRPSAKASDKVRYVLSNRTSPTTSTRAQSSGSTENCSMAQRKRGQSSDTKSPAGDVDGLSSLSKAGLDTMGPVPSGHAHRLHYCSPIADAGGQQSQDAADANETAWHFVPLPKSDSQLSVDLSAPFPQSPELRMKSDVPAQDVSCTRDPHGDDGNCASPAFFAPGGMGLDSAEDTVAESSAEAHAGDETLALNEGNEAYESRPFENPSFQNKTDILGQLSKGTARGDYLEKSSPKKKDSNGGNWLRRSLDLTKRTTDRWLSRAISGTPNSSSVLCRKLQNAGRRSSHRDLSMSASDDAHVRMSTSRQPSLFEKSFFRPKSTSLPSQAPSVALSSSLGSIDWLSEGNRARGSVSTGPGFSASTPLAETKETSRQRMMSKRRTSPSTIPYSTTSEEGLATLSNSPIKKEGHAPLQPLRSLPSDRNPTPPLRKNPSTPEVSTSSVFDSQCNSNSPLKSTSPVGHEVLRPLKRYPTAPEGSARFASMANASPKPSRISPSLLRHPSAVARNTSIPVSNSPAKRDGKRSGKPAKIALPPPSSVLGAFTEDTSCNTSALSSHRAGPLALESPATAAAAADLILSGSVSLGKNSTVRQQDLRNGSSTWIDSTELQQCVDIHATDQLPKSCESRPEASVEVIDLASASQEQSYRLLAGCDTNEAAHFSRENAPPAPNCSRESSYHMLAASTVEAAPPLPHRSAKQLMKGRGGRQKSPIAKSSVLSSSTSNISDRKVWVNCVFCTFKDGSCLQVLSQTY